MYVFINIHSHTKHEIELDKHTIHTNTHTHIIHEEEFGEKLLIN